MWRIYIIAPHPVCRTRGAPLRKRLCRWRERTGYGFYRRMNSSSIATAGPGTLSKSDRNARAAGFHSVQQGMNLLPDSDLLRGLTERGCVCRGLAT